MILRPMLSLIRFSRKTFWTTHGILPLSRIIMTTCLSPLRPETAPTTMKPDTFKILYDGEDGTEYHLEQYNGVVLWWNYGDETINSWKLTLTRRRPSILLPWTALRLWRL